MTKQRWWYVIIRDNGSAYRAALKNPGKSPAGFRTMTVFADDAKSAMRLAELRARDRMRKEDW